jgi:hypothetical protein
VREGAAGGRRCVTTDVSGAPGRRPGLPRFEPMLLRVIAAVSGVYDVFLGVSLLSARPILMQVFGLATPTPPIHADLNGLFTVAIGIGYLLPYRDPDRYRAYLWLMGPALKGVGAAWFIVDHFVRESPSAYLWFAATDGTLALVTLWALVTTRVVEHRTSAS